MLESESEEDSLVYLLFFLRIDFANWSRLSFLEAIAFSTNTTNETFVVLSTQRYEFSCASLCQFNKKHLKFLVKNQNYFSGYNFYECHNIPLNARPSLYDLFKTHSCINGKKCSIYDGFYSSQEMRV